MEAPLASVETALPPVAVSHWRPVKRDDVLAARYLAVPRSDDYAVELQVVRPDFRLETKDLANGPVLDVLKSWGVLSRDLEGMARGRRHVAHVTACDPSEAQLHEAGFKGGKKPVAIALLHDSLDMTWAVRCRTIEGGFEQGGLDRKIALEKYSTLTRTDQREVSEQADLNLAAQSVLAQERLALSRKLLEHATFAVRQAVDHATSGKHSATTRQDADTLLTKLATARADDPVSTPDVRSEAGIAIAESYSDRLLVDDQHLETSASDVEYESATDTQYDDRNPPPPNADNDWMLDDLTVGNDSDPDQLPDGVLIAALPITPRVVVPGSKAGVAKTAGKRARKKRTTSEMEL